MVGMSASASASATAPAEQSQQNPLSNEWGDWVLRNMKMKTRLLRMESRVDEDHGTNVRRRLRRSSRSRAHPALTFQVGPRPAYVRRVVPRVVSERTAEALLREGKKSRQEDGRGDARWVRAPLSRVCRRAVVKGGENREW